MDDKALNKRLAQFCDHSNEAPLVCPCIEGCYCKSHTCRVQGKTGPVVPGWAGSEDFGGSDYDTGFETGWDRNMRGNMEVQDKESQTSFDFDRWQRDAAQFTNAQITHQPVPATNMLVDSRQPMPTINNNPYVHDLVMKDFADRAEFGKSKYGTYLQADNGRDSLKDAYQESLDLSQYLRLLIFKRDGK